MTDSSNVTASLSNRLARIQEFEAEFMRKIAAEAGQEAAISHADMFVLGAVRRTLAQAKGFRELVVSKNFPCAAGILRMQIDTAMRVNALTLVENRDACCQAVLEGTKFNSLKDAGGNKLTDAFLRKQLSEAYPWVTPVYEQASDFIHLSGRHLYNSILTTDDESRTVRFVIGGTDPSRPDEAYFEIVDAFFESTKIIGLMLLGYFSARTGRFKEPQETP